MLLYFTKDTMIFIVVVLLLVTLVNT